MCKDEKTLKMVQKFFMPNFDLIHKIIITSANDLKSTIQKTWDLSFMLNLDGQIRMFIPQALLALLIFIYKKHLIM